MDSRPLTKTQLALYDYLVAFIKRERRWPLYTEIQNNFDWSSPNTVNRAYKWLIEKGYLIKVDVGQYQFTGKVPGQDDLPDSVLEHSNHKTQEA